MNLARTGSRKRASPSRTQLAGPVQLVELVPARTLRTPGRYVVRVGPNSVEVDEQFDETTLRRLVTVLSSC